MHNDGLVLLVKPGFMAGWLILTVIKNNGEVEGLSPARFTMASSSCLTDETAKSSSQDAVAVLGVVNQEDILGRNDKSTREWMSWRQK